MIYYIAMLVDILSIFRGPSEARSQKPLLCSISLVKRTIGTPATCSDEMRHVRGIWISTRSPNQRYDFWVVF